MITYHNLLTKQQCDEIIQFFYDHNQSASMTPQNTVSLAKFEHKLIHNIHVDVANQNNLLINYYQIVRWGKNTHMDKHIDTYLYNDGNVTTKNYYTSILYLNDDFVGGETVVDDVIVKPEIGKMILFDGGTVPHQVLKIIKGVRHTIPCWYRLNHILPDAEEHPYRKTQFL